MHWQSYRMNGYNALFGDMFAELAERELPPFHRVLEIRPLDTAPIQVDEKLQEDVPILVEKGFADEFLKVPRIDGFNRDFFLEYPVCREVDRLAIRAVLAPDEINVKKLSA
jgi:hypothetical protein